MHLNWFRRTGLLYIPASMPAWLIAAATIIYSIYITIDINARQHSVSDFLMNLFFNLLIIGAVYTLIAYLTSKH
ncbi:hypothetical protein ACX0G9_25255 [Flavitalea flava]